MVPQAHYTDELRGCKDRFLIQSIPVNDTSEAESSEVFNGHGRQDFRLKVIVVSASCTLDISYTHLWSCCRSRQ